MAQSPRNIIRLRKCFRNASLFPICSDIDSDIDTDIDTDRKEFCVQQTFRCNLSDSVAEFSDALLKFLRR